MPLREAKDPQVLSSIVGVPPTAARRESRCRVSVNSTNVVSCARSAPRESFFGVDRLAPPLLGRRVVGLLLRRWASPGGLVPAANCAHFPAGCLASGDTWRLRLLLFSGLRFVPWGLVWRVATQSNRSSSALCVFREAAANFAALWKNRETRIRMWKETD